MHLHVYSYPHDTFTMHVGAILLAQWMNPCCGIKEEKILAQIDQIADTVAAHLLSTHAKRLPDSKDASEDAAETDGSAPKCSRLESPNVDQRCRVSCLKLPAEEVLDALNSTLYGVLGFRRGLREHYYDIDNSYIHKARYSCTCTFPCVYACTHPPLIVWQA